MVKKNPKVKNNKKFDKLTRSSTFGVSEKIVNILKLLNHFDSGNSYTVKQLATEIGVSEKTIYRYFKTLKAAYVPIYRDSVTLRYSFYSGYTLKKIGLSEDEVSVLATLKNLVTNLGIPFATSFNSVLDKVTYKARGDIKLEKSNSELPIWINIDESKDFYKFEKIFSIISKSIKDTCRLNMTYFTLSRRTTTKRSIDPYGLIYSNGFWIMVAYCHFRGEVRHFSVDNIRELEITDKYFFYPEDFNLAEHVKRSWRYYSGKTAEVLVRFDEEIKHTILRREKWHPTQKVINNSDGSVTLSFTVAGTEEIKHWIYKFLPNCEVLAPPYLRETIKKDLLAALNKYKKN